MRVPEADPVVAAAGGTRNDGGVVVVVDVTGDGELPPRARPPPPTPPVRVVSANGSSGIDILTRSAPDQGVDGYMRKGVE